jgi:hypothetical protein
MRPDDAFWAARIVSRFSAVAIRAIVEKARYSDPRATDYMAETLIERREKVLRTWLNGVNPVVDLALSRDGQLTWRNAAVDARVAEAPQSYTLRWFELDNAADTRRDIGSTQTVTMASASAPADLLQVKSNYIGVIITAQHARHAAWAKPATFHFRRTSDGWAWVGAERD